MIFGLFGRRKNRVAEMIAAARAGDIEEMKELLSTGVDIDAAEPESGDTPLLAALDKEQWAMAELLLTQKPNLWRKDNEGNTPLYLTVCHGDSAIEMVKRLLEAGAPVDLGPHAGENAGVTPLHVCCATGANACIEALLARGASVSRQLPDGATPLHTAAIGGDLRTAELLCQAGGSVAALNEEKRTPLHNCGITGNAEVAAVLIEHGAVVDAPDARSRTPLVLAAMHGHVDVIRLLLDKGADVIGSRSASSLDAARSNEHEAAARLISAAIRKRKAAEKRASMAAREVEDLWERIVQATARNDRDGLRAVVNGKAFSSLPIADRLLVACELGDAEIARNLLQAGADVDARMRNGLTPLMHAAGNGASECVDLFLDAGADIDAVAEENGVGAFGLALNRLHLQLAEHLLSRGAEPNFGAIETLPLAIAEHGSLAFIQALEARGCKLVRDGQRARMAFVSARNPDPEVFDHLLSQGADPGQGNNLGYTPLILAALNNHHLLIRRYLTRGDDAAVRDCDGETALSLAIEKRHGESIEVLREFHVEKDDCSALEPVAAMLKAAENGSLGSILDLRDGGVSINCCDEQGNSALMTAARAGHHGVVRSLYHLGADIDHRNHAGETALSLAQASGSTGIVSTLREFGALDTTPGESPWFSAGLGGTLIHNLADGISGRMSHPYKEQPPYDDDEDDEDDPDADESGQDDRDAGESAEVRPGNSAAGMSVGRKLDLAIQALDSDLFRERLPETVREELAQRLDHYRRLVEESGYEIDGMAELNQLMALLGFDQEEAEEVEPTSLFEAVHARDLAAVRKIVKGGGDVDQADDDGNTPLFLAALTGQEKLVAALLKLGADPDRARPDGKGPLFAAVRAGHEKIVGSLLKGGAEVDAPLSVDHNGTPVGGCTVLYVAALIGHLPCCKALVGNGASIEAANDLGYTPLMAAIEGDHEEVVDFLLKNGADVNPEVVDTMGVEGLGGASPLYTATRKENLVLVRKLLKRGADVDRPSSNGWTSLKSAARQGNPGIVKILLESGADPDIADDTGYTPLMNAVSGGYEDIARMLLKFKADPNVQGGENPGDDDWESGRSALMDAAVGGNVAIARALLKVGANPNLLDSRGRTALHSAVASASTDMVELLLKSGADPDVFGNDEERTSALDLALHRWAGEDEAGREGGVSDVLELMLKKGMPGDRGSLNETALDLVAQGHLEVVEFLEKHGFLVDANHSWRGANQLFLMAAMGNGGLQAAELLLRMGADANCRNPAGLSVLSLAARNGSVRMAELLLKAGADVMDRIGVNLLAYDVAVIYRQDEVVDLLIEHMNRCVPAVDRQADDGTTALMRAVMAEDVKTIKDLIMAGADAGRRDRNGDSPLSYAVTHELDDAVRILRAAGVERLPDDKLIGHESIVNAGNQGALGTILDLLDSGVPIDVTDAGGDTALTAADGHPGVVRVLARRGADLSHRNREGKTAYGIAAARKRILMVETLQEVGAPIDEPEEPEGFAKLEALLDALTGKSTASDAEESDDDPDAEASGDELLMACRFGDASAVSRQIAAGTDVDYVNDEGFTPLTIAISGLGLGGMSRRRERDFEQIIDSLLAAGADPGMGSVPALILVAATHRLHLVNAMLRAGADVDAVAELPVDEEGGTMLATALVAALLSDEQGALMGERVSLALLEAGPDLSFSSDDGSMAVHFAAKAGMSKVLSRILDLAPEAIDVQNEEGSTPLMLAAADGHADAIDVLLERGANRELRDAGERTAARPGLADG